MSVAPFAPASEADIADFLRDRTTTGVSVAVQGGRTKSGLGRPDHGDATPLALAGLSGILLYEPEELVLTARAGTPLAEIENALSARRQCLAFEPPDLAALFGETGQGTLGGVVAAGLSGPRRIKAGAVRDHVLGARAVGGDGKIFKSGGRVVKNVTGFDLPKLLTGSHGTLAVLTEITLKVLPAPETTRTLLVAGPDAAAGTALLSEALRGPWEISGAAHLPEAAAARSAVLDSVGIAGPITALRLEGFAPSVMDRLAVLDRILATRGSARQLDDEASRPFWREVRDVSRWFDADRIVWRLCLPPSDAATAVDRIAAGGPVEAVYDWGGGLVWLAIPPGGDARAQLIRNALPSGHATLIRAPAPMRAGVPVFAPQNPALAALTRRVKTAFDPGSVLNRGRMYEGV